MQTGGGLVALHLQRVDQGQQCSAIGHVVVLIVHPEPAVDRHKIGREFVFPDAVLGEADAIDVYGHVRQDVQKRIRMPQRTGSELVVNCPLYVDIQRVIAGVLPHPGQRPGVDMREAVAQHAQDRLELVALEAALPYAVQINRQRVEPHDRFGHLAQRPLPQRYVQQHVHGGVDVSQRDGHKLNASTMRGSSTGTGSSVVRRPANFAHAFV